MCFLHLNRRSAVGRLAHLPKNILRIRFLALLAPCLLALTLSSSQCDEPPPAYQNPGSLFDAKIQPLYVLTSSDNSLWIFLVLRCIFDETLQGTTDFRGTIQIVSVRDSSIKKTFSISSANIVAAKGFDRTAGVLTIDPGDSVRLAVSWNLSDDAGKDLRHSFFLYVKDPACPSRCLALTEDFTLTGELTLFEETGPVLFGPLSYHFCHISTWVNPRDCPPIITDEPCAVRVPQNGIPCTLPSGSQ